MAEKITDDELRKEIIALSGEKIGPITGSTRSIYLKKLNHLRAKQKSTQKKPGRRKSGGRNLVGFSSEESGEDDDEESEALDDRSRGLRSRSRRAPPPSQSVSRRCSDIIPQPPKPPPSRPSRTRSSNSSVVPTPSSSAGPRPRGRESFDSRPSTQRRSLGRLSLGLVRDGQSDTKTPTGIRGRMGRRSDIVRPLSSREREFDIDDSSQEDEDDYYNRRNDLTPGLQMPDVDSFNSSDSDLEPGEMPEMVSRSINTSPGLDTSVLSYGSSFTATPGPRTRSASNSVAQTPNSSVSNHSPQQDSAYPMRKVPIYRTRRAHHEATGQSFSHYVSTFLLVLAALFFVVLAFAYLQMVGNPEESVINQLQICSAKEKHNCLEKNDAASVKELVNTLATVLSERAGAYDCGDEDVPSRNMTLTEAKTLIGKQHQDWLSPKKKEKSILQTVLGLIARNPSWLMRLLDKDGQAIEVAEDGKVEEAVDKIYALESDDPTKSLWCRLYQSMTKVMYLLLVIVAAALLVTMGIAYVRHRRRRQENETREVYELVEKIIDILKTHHDVCQKNKDLQPYLAIPHIRDMLIPPADRRKRQTVWDKAVKFLSMNESRVRVESQKIAGEEFPVWRWLQSCSNGERVWIGPAFGEYKDTGLNSPPNTPAPCLKIRNMFDLDIEIGEDWHVRVEDAILEKCGDDHGIVHIVVDTSSHDGCVYVKCQSLEAAGRAYKVLHGWWFDGNLVTVKFLRLERYHERFPDATKANTPLQPSNNQCLSLSQPFHRSIIETS